MDPYFKPLQAMDLVGPSLPSSVESVGVYTPKQPM